MGIAAAMGGDMGSEWFEAMTNSPALAKWAHKKHHTENSRLKQETDKQLKNMAASVSPEEQAWLDAELAKWVAKQKV
jgi:predicted solute-binding protein